MAASAHVWLNGSRDDLLSLHIRTSMSVDQRRLFHAFTLPEYLELWLIPPSARIRCKSAAGPGSPMEFLLHSSSRDQSSSIKTVYYFLNEPSRIVLGWQKEDYLSSLETIVSIDLFTRGETTLLNLAQSGFDSARARTWHEVFWRSKLANLQSILSAHGAAMSRTRSSQTPSRISRVVERM
jgi:uncharacterized protein YndB with AHSA1/START domain